MMLLTASAFAQEHTLIILSGEQGDPLEHAVITDTNTSRVWFSDKRGQCRIPENTTHLSITHIGYKSIGDYRLTGNLRDTIYLLPHRMQLDEVHLVATHPRVIYQRLIRARRSSGPKLLTYREAFLVDGLPRRQLQAQFAVNRLRTRFVQNHKWYRQFSIYGYNLDYMKSSPESSPWDRGFVPNRDIARLFYLNTTVGFLFRPDWLWSWHERAGPANHRQYKFNVRHKNWQDSRITGFILYPQEENGAYCISFEYLPGSDSKQALRLGEEHYGRRLSRQQTELWIDYRQGWLSLSRVRFIEEGRVYDSGSSHRYSMEIELFNHGEGRGLPYSKSVLDPHQPWYRQLGKENPDRIQMGYHPEQIDHGSYYRSREE